MMTFWVINNGTKIFFSEKKEVKRAKQKHIGLICIKLNPPYQKTTAPRVLQHS